MAVFDIKTVGRFWSKVDVRSRDECWEWQAARFHNGYGAFGVGRKAMSAHRVAYMLENGFILSSMLVLHSCDNRPCCNPSHLRTGTYRDNVDDMVRKGRSHGRRCSRVPEHVKTEIRQRLHPQPVLAKMHGLNLRTVAKIQGAR